MDRLLSYHRAIQIFLVLMDSLESLSVYDTGFRTFGTRACLVGGDSGNSNVRLGVCGIVNQEEST